MAKTKTIFICQQCGSQSPKWLGKCPACGEWNTYVEEVVQATPSGKSVSKKTGRSGKPRLISTITTENHQRLLTPDQEFNRVTGGGLVPGSIVLIGGEPGIGKSTLLLQIVLKLKDLKVLYLSGEESPEQIRSRADRLGLTGGSCFLMNEVNLETIFAEMEETGPELIIIDSIQTIYSDQIDSPPGSISQVRHCAMEFMKFAKESGKPVLLIGHITKEGSLAGPKVLEHIVDTVLQFEGERTTSYRLLRSLKNRYGSTSELGIYEMLEDGMREVTNPSEILLTQRVHPVNGVATAAMMEGFRPLLIEVQSLVSTAAFATPQRSSTGFDQKRLQMLLAVIEKKGGFRLGIQDVFLNIAGGIKVDDPAIDLSVCMAVLSSYLEKPIEQKTCFAAEVGLTGEVRGVNKLEARISEALRLGFDKVVISKFNKLKNKNGNKIKVAEVSTLYEAIKEIFD